MQVATRRTLSFGQGSGQAFCLITHTKSLALNHVGSSPFMQTRVKHFSNQFTALYCMLHNYVQQACRCQMYRGNETNTHTYIHTNTYLHSHKYRHTYLLAYTQTNKYTHTYILLTYIHTLLSRMTPYANEIIGEY